jgi:hypothetical protein
MKLRLVIAKVCIAKVCAALTMFLFLFLLRMLLNELSALPRKQRAPGA